MKNIFTFTVLSCMLLLINSQEEKKIVCYWNSNSHLHTGLPGEFHASDIDPTICTHIIYTYIWFTQRLVLNWTPEDKSTDFVRLKIKNPFVKLLISVGGPRWGSQTPSQIMSTETGRSDLSNAIKTFLDGHQSFDGVDIDWQWPNQGTGSQEDYDNFPKFLSLLKKTLPEKIISISVAPRNEDIQKSYDIPEIIDSVDIINLNSFDLRGVLTDTSTAFHSPYRKDINDRRPEAEWNAESIIKSWITRGIEPQKLTLGIPTYGRSFTLLDSNDYGVEAPIVEIGKQSKFLSEGRPEKQNVIPYGEICMNINQENSLWTEYWNHAHFAPYAVFDDDQWIGYDNEESVLVKLHLVVDNNLGGVNYASIDYDDFAGNCGPKFPLINFGYQALANDSLKDNPLDTTTTTAGPGISSPSTTTSTEKTTTITVTTTRTTRPTTTSKITSTFKTPPITPSTEKDVTDEYKSTENSTISTSTVESKTTVKEIETTQTKTPAVTPITITETTSSEQVSKDTTFPDDPNFFCPRPSGNFKHPNDCSKFIICSHNIPYEFNCQPGLYYNEINDQCDYPSNVEC